jgi:hypothetical protein
MADMPAASPIREHTINKNNCAPGIIGELKISTRII